MSDSRGFIVHAHHVVPVGEQAGAATDESTPPDMPTSTFAGTPCRRATAAGTTSRARSTSASVVVHPRLRRNAPQAQLWRDAHRRGTCDACWAPLAHAEAAEAHPGLVEKEQRRLALDSRQAHVEGAGQAAGAAGPVSRARDGTEQAVGQAVPAEAGGGRRGLTGGGCGPRAAASRRCRRRRGCRCAAALLAAPATRAWRRAAPRDQGADPAGRRPCAS